MKAETTEAIDSNSNIKQCELTVKIQRYMIQPTFSLHLLFQPD